MHTYLLRTEFAVKELIQTMNRASQQLGLLNKEEFEFSFKEQARRLKPVFRSAWERDADQSAFRSGVSADTAKLKFEYAMGSSALRCVLDVCATGLLQIAKQGIAIAEKWEKNCPHGRQIRGEWLRNVIWHGRNQTMHHEEDLLPLETDLTKKQKNSPIFKSQKKMIDCLSKLGFSLTNDLKRSLAWEVVKLLDWTTYENFRRDMLSLLKP